MPTPAYQPSPAAAAPKDRRKEAIARLFVVAWRAADHLREEAERCGSANVVLWAAAGQDLLHDGNCPEDAELTRVSAEGKANPCLARAADAYVAACTAACSGSMKWEEHP